MITPLGVVLAGGASSRMGRDKALVEIGGRRMIDLAADALRSAGLDVVVAGPARVDVELPVIGDAAGSGPVAGLVGVLEARPGEALFLTAVDQPLLRPETVRRLVARQGDIVAPRSGGVLQVTCAVYRPGVLEAARAVLASPRASLLALTEAAATVAIEEEEWRAWGEDGRSWRSVDRPADIAAAAAILGG